MYGMVEQYIDYGIWYDSYVRFTMMSPVSPSSSSSSSSFLYQKWSDKEEEDIDGDDEVKAKKAKEVAPKHHHNDEKKGRKQHSSRSSLSGFSYIRLMVTGTDASGRWGLNGLRGLELFGVIGDHSLREIPKPIKTERFAILQVSSSEHIEKVIKAFDKKEVDTLLLGSSSSSNNNSSGGTAGMMRSCFPRVVQIEALPLRNVGLDLQKCAVNQVYKDKLFFKASKRERKEGKCGKYKEGEGLLIPTKRFSAALDEILNRHVITEGQTMPLLEAQDILQCE
eukprot:jgi/Bigna1/133332/aug1.21_g8040